MRILKLNESFTLESGAQIPEVQIEYTLQGSPSADGSNIVWVFHALSGNADVMDWWPGLFGAGKIFDPQSHCVVCATALGSPYGPTRPRSKAFPAFTVRDVSRLHVLLAERLGFRKIGTLIGASFGGAQALEFAYQFKGTIDRMILISCASAESPWGIANHEAQRMAIESDPSFGLPGGGRRGLAAARAMALLTYRTTALFNQRQSDQEERPKQPRAASYLQYNGHKFVRRFDALCYHYLSQCLDSHHLGRERGSVQSVLRELDIPALVIGVDSDQLVPFNEQAKLARWLPQGTLKRLRSDFGHDAFLVETTALADWISPFLQTDRRDSDPVKNRARHKGKERHTFAPTK